MLGLGGGDAHPGPGLDQRLEHFFDSREHPAFLHADRLIPLLEVTGGLLRRLPVEAVDLHEFIHQGRPGKAAQFLQLRFNALLFQGVLGRFCDSLHRVEHGAVKVEKDVFIHVFTSWADYIILRHITQGRSFRSGLNHFYFSPPQAAFTTMPDSSTRAMALGITISWLNISASSHTRSLDRQEPRKMNTMAMTE